MTVALVSRDQLYDYLVPRFDVNEVDGLVERQGTVLELCTEMATDFALLYPEWVRLDAYYRGYPPMPQEPKRLTRKYRELVEMSRSNWCGLVVDVVNERLIVGSISSTTDSVQDKTAWKWWNTNNMDGMSPQIHCAALRYGICYISVWPGTKGPVIRGESPATTYVRYNHDTDEPVAAIRIWQDNNLKSVHADLTLADYQYHLTARDAVLNEPAIFDSAGLTRKSVTVDLTNVRWDYRLDGDRPPVESNPMGMVPYVRMLTEPDLTGGYTSELSGLESIQDRINRTNFDRLLAQSFQSFPRAWATGVETPINPSTGKPIEPFDAAVDRFWTFENENAKVGQLDAAELSGYIAANTSDVQALATQSRTPPHYLISGMGMFPSGESVRATEYGLSRKVQARQQSYGDAWSAVLRLCGAAAGNKRLANDLALSVIWKDVEARSEAEIVDALTKMGSIGVPWPALWQRWGATPEEIEEWTKELEEKEAEEERKAAEIAAAGPADPSAPGAIPQTPPASGSSTT
jgi:Phage portal protein, SPP1 Gp6-like